MDLDKGVYYIRDRIKGRIYIGSSKNLKVRFKTHINTLLNETHHNSYLQNIANKYGTHILEFGIIEFNPEDLLEREKYWIQELKPELNIGVVGGGDNFTNHPEKERIRELHRKNLEKLRLEGRIGSVGFEDKNPNWKGGKSYKKICPSCNKYVIYPTSDRCKKCENGDRVGENNSFYGKTHSLDARKNMSESKKDKPNLKSRKKVYGDGVIYGSNAEAAKELGLSAGTITFRCNSKSIKWVDWYYLEKD